MTVTNTIITSNSGRTAYSLSLDEDTGAGSLTVVQDGLTVSVTNTMREQPTAADLAAELAAREAQAAANNAPAAPEPEPPAVPEQVQSEAALVPDESAPAVPPVDVSPATNTTTETIAAPVAEVTFDPPADVPIADTTVVDPTPADTTPASPDAPVAPV